MVNNIDRVHAWYISSNYIVPCIVLPFFTALFFSNRKSHNYRYINLVAVNFIISNLGLLLAQICFDYWRNHR